jgi:DNA polymerase
MGRTNVVFGVGSVNTKLVIVGEAPGEKEDNSGIPFVGPAGKKLNEILQKVGIERNSVYICNVVKCRPPGNRNPADFEMKQCGRYLKAQISIIKPEAILTLGNIATGFFLNIDGGITRLRGKMFRYEHIKIFPTFHPSYILIHPEEEDKVYDDIKRLKEMMDYG